MLGDFGKLIVAKGFKMLPKVQKIARSGNTVWHSPVIDGIIWYYPKRNGVSNQSEQRVSEKVEISINKKYHPYLYMVKG